MTTYEENKTTTRSPDDDSNLVCCYTTEEDDLPFDVLLSSIETAYLDPSTMSKGAEEPEETMTQTNDAVEGLPPAANNDDVVKPPVLLFNSNKEWPSNNNDNSADPPSSDAINTTSSTNNNDDAMPLIKQNSRTPLFQQRDDPPSDYYYPEDNEPSQRHDFHGGESFEAASNKGQQQQSKNKSNPRMLFVKQGSSRTMPLEDSEDLSFSIMRGGGGVNSIRCLRMGSAGKNRRYRYRYLKVGRKVCILQIVVAILFALIIGSGLTLAIRTRFTFLRGGGGPSSPSSAATSTADEDDEDGPNPTMAPSVTYPSIRDPSLDDNTDLYAAPDTAPEPALDPRPAPESAPKPEPAPEQAPEPAPEPEPEPEPAPEPAPEPVQVVTTPWNDDGAMDDITAVLEREKILLQNRQPLETDQTVSLYSHGVFLKQHEDGNLVLYKNTTTDNDDEFRGIPIWSSGVRLTPGQYFTMVQGDGHMMTMEGTPAAQGPIVWKSDSGWGEDGNSRLVLNDDGTGIEILQSELPPNKMWSSVDGAQPRTPNTTPVILQSGPMVGHTTHHSTKIWFLTADPASSTVEVIYQQLAEDEDSDSGMIPVTPGTTIDMPPREEHNGSSLAAIDDLEPSTTYDYVIRVDGNAVAQGRFKTAPPPRLPVKFRYLLTSCLNVRKRKGYPEQPVWDTIRAKGPDFAMINGDTVYFTGSDYNKETGVIYGRVLQRHLEQRREPHFAKFVSSIPTYMTWDDHDFGENNAFGDQKGKENSLAAVKALWANPSYGTNELPGVFYTYYWGNVHFLVLDDRWYRRQGSQFGEQQVDWLCDQLLQSRGVFKIIVSGGTILDYDDHVWIGKFVKKHSIYGVLFNSGDTHKNEFLSRPHDHWPYNIIQFTSSGIARENWMRPWAMLNVDTEASDPSVSASFYGAENDYTFSTWSNEPDMICTDLELVQDSVAGRYNLTRCTQTVRLSDLTPDDVADVVLESPMGGDELIAGSKITVSWRAFDSEVVERVMLQYSLDAGVSWDAITYDWEDNNGSYEWIVPNQPSVEVKLRILGRGDGGRSIAENYGLMSITTNPEDWE